MSIVTGVWKVTPVNMMDVEGSEYEIWDHDRHRDVGHSG